MDVVQTAQKGVSSALKAVLSGILSVLKTMLKIAGWLLIVTAVCALGLALAVPIDSVPIFIRFLLYWFNLLYPAVIIAAIASIVPKARYTPVFTPVVAAAIAVLLLSVLLYVVVAL